MHSSVRSGRLAALLSLGLIAGCGSSTDDLPRAGVAGKVKLDGDLLSKGMISFNPESEAAGGKGIVSVGAVIDNGAYEIAKTNGPTPGKYKVSIIAADSGEPIPTKEGEAPGAPPKSKGGVARKPALPAKYNTKTELSVEIKPGSNTFDYNLESK